MPDGYTAVPPKVNLNPMPLYHRPDLRTYLTQPWESLASYLKRSHPGAHHFCPFCHQWLIQPRGLRAHTKAEHMPIHTCCATAVARTQEHRRLLALGSTCRYCTLALKGAPSKHATECSVLFLVHLLQAVFALHYPPPPLPTPPQACHDHPFDVRDTGEPGGYGASGHRGADEINAAIVQGGPATPGPMEGVTDLDQTEEKADRTGRPAKWQRDNSKGSTQPGKGKGAQGRGPAQSKPPPFQVPCAREVAPPDLNRPAPKDRAMGLLPGQICR